MTAIQKAWKAGFFQHRYWLSNVISGVTISIDARPDSFKIPDDKPA